MASVLFGLVAKRQNQYATALQQAFLRDSLYQSQNNMRPAASLLRQRKSDIRKMVIDHTSTEMTVHRIDCFSSSKTFHRMKAANLMKCTPTKHFPENISPNQSPPNTNE